MKKLADEYPAMLRIAGFEVERGFRPREKQ
jgi:hypothetical protein